MVITYYGGYFLKITQGDLTIAVNPFGKDSDYKPVRFGSDIALISVNDKNMNGIENLEYGERKPFVVSGPGEYEIKGVAISGFQSPKPYGKDNLLNTIYSMQLEDISLCFVGPLTSIDFSAALYEGIGKVDILFVPISGDGVLKPTEAEKLANQLDVSIIIPIAYDDKQLLAFKKEMSAEDVIPLDKLSIKKKDLAGKEAEVVILESALK
jgi:L-ascorbate metabolism protein UlaG (beta-lactamase superfamily)